MPSAEDSEIRMLFIRLVDVLEKNKKIKRSEIASRLIYEIYGMWTTTKSEILHESAIWIEPEIANRLMEEGLVQRITTEKDEKYALTLTGIAQCISTIYGKKMNEQFSDFLTLVDQKFNTVEKVGFDWKEKLGIITLLLLSGTAKYSAIRLNNETNKKFLAEALQKTLDVLKKYEIINKKEKLKGVARGESIASAHMCRLNKLSRKTNHYYKGKNLEYYLDIEKDEIIDENKLSFMLRKVFDFYNPDCNYEMMDKELASISQDYYHKFLDRSPNPLILYNISKNITKFMEFDIMKLPMKQ